MTGRRRALDEALAALFLTACILAGCVAVASAVEAVALVIR